MEKIVGQTNMTYFRELFDTLDKDKSGQLDRKELELALKYTANRPDQLDFYLSLGDSDNNGTLDFNEFMFLILISQSDFNDVKKSSEVFDKFDSNQNGKLEKSEVSECFKAIGMKFDSSDNNNLFEELFRILDLDNSGYLNKIEFYMMIESLRRHVQS